jgi:hypothetical protein
MENRTFGNEKWYETDEKEGIRCDPITMNQMQPGLFGKTNGSMVAVARVAPASQ